jgi:hypothetical protein
MGWRWAGGRARRAIPAHRKERDEWGTRRFAERNMLSSFHVESRSEVEVAKKTWEVFGISNDVLPDSYVDRGALDEQLGELIARDKVHIALRGASKCGKSWLRRKVLDNPIVIQCRLGKGVLDLYVDALSQLGIEFHTDSKSSKQFKGSVKATGDIGFKLLAKVGLEASADSEFAVDHSKSPVGRNIDDLRYVAEIIKASNRKLVIEDFHYLSVGERKNFSFDLKAFWDWGLQVVVVGVWSVDNMLLTLNPDLAGRIEEITITWSDSDLEKILDKGGPVLNISFEGSFRARLIASAFGNAGQLQTLVLRALDDAKLKETQISKVTLSSLTLAESAAMEYAEQLNPLYQTFAQNVANGIRSRKNSTGIYAHAMAVIMKASDEDLIRGLSVDRIFTEASKREPRILLGNLKSILTKIESLQIDEDGRGMVLSYNPDIGVSVVDRQLLLYRKFATVNWPWDTMIAQAETGNLFQADDQA